MVKKRFNIDKKIKIFDYHFPNYPIFPGALLLDWIITENWREYLYTNEFNASFMQPIVPGCCIDIAVNGFLAEVYLEGRLAAKIERLEGIEPSCERWTTVSIGEWKKPNAIQPLEILYLEGWNNVEHSGQWFRGVGVAKYKEIPFLNDISDKKIKGVNFFFMELFGVLATSLLLNEKKIKLEQGFGLGKIRHLQVFRPLRVGELLWIQVECKTVGVGSIMKGEIFSQNELIVSLEQGIGMPFIKNVCRFSGV